MAPIPADMAYVETAVDLAARVAHRLGKAAVELAELTVGERRGALPPPRHSPACDPEQPATLRLMSAARAAELGVAACTHARCFGPVLAAGPREWRTLSARTPAAPARKRTTKAVAR